MATIDYPSVYALQDKVLAAIFSKETTFYLTGDTCLNRFYYHRRYSDDLDLFTNENALFRDDVRILLEHLTSSNIHYLIQVDTRVFVRLLIEERLQVDLVNDRVYRHDKSIHSASGYILDNVLNICANKLCTIIGRDDPKDMFDIFTIFENAEIDWEIVIIESEKKCVLDPEILEYRLSSFPLKLLDLLNVVDPLKVNEMKKGYPLMVEHILHNIPQ